MQNYAGNWLKSSTEKLFIYRKFVRYMVVRRLLATFAVGRKYNTETMAYEKKIPWI